MSQLAVVQLLFGALALVMAGLGLSLQSSDFTALLGQKRAVAVALGLQTVVLPLIAFALAEAMRLPAIYAVGLMILAASPGGISANLYSHLFGGNVALNISLTGLNTLLSVVTMPLICGWSLAYFGDATQTVPSPVTKVAEVIAIVLIPVALGMVVRARAPGFAARAERPMRVISAFVLIVFIIAAIAKEWGTLRMGLVEVGSSVVIFNAISLLLGYSVARAASLDQQGAIAIGFEIGIHNAVLAIFIAMTALNNPLFALPAAVYSITMNMLGFAFGLWVRGRSNERVARVLEQHPCLPLKPRSAETDSSAADRTHCERKEFSSRRSCHWLKRKSVRNKVPLRRRSG
jgi:BASS family bile acid:Na+ symporter